MEELVNARGHPGNPNASYTLSGLDYANSYVDKVQMSTSGSQGADCYVDEICVTPEPTTLSLLALGGVGLLRRRRTRRR